MIRRFERDSALVVIDVQQGVNLLQHWGGTTGRRNNPAAEQNIGAVLEAWRRRELPVYFTAHDSLEAASPLKLRLETGRFIQGLEPKPNEPVIAKSANSAFVGTGLEVALRRRRIHRLLFVGFFTNFCVETSVRMANNMGFDTYLAHDACATCNRVGLDGEDYDPELVHALSIASMHREFCTAISTADAIALSQADAPHLERIQGNE
ncbi:MAG TPA: isochorismatase family protein [Dongiaceae bacterium]|nr:isochorismatase family protein [Dongiaceae bacterium]